jgi:hypothetical protein
MKKRVKVKSFTRKGRIVKAYDRLQDDKKLQQYKNIIKGVSLIGGSFAAIKNADKLYKLFRLAKIQSKVNKINIKPLNVANVKSPIEKLNILNTFKIFNGESTNTIKLVTKDGVNYIYKEGRDNLDSNILSNLSIGSYPHGNEQATEALISSIGNKFKIPVQETEIIAANQIFDGKKAGLPGSLHKIVDGVPASELFKDMNFVVANPVSKSKYSKVIDNILLNKDTAKIGALDIFVGNADRNAGNLFYNISNGAFTAIDNGSAYTLPFDYDSLTKIIKSKSRKLNETKRRNLNQLRDTLTELHNNYTPEQLVNEYDRNFLKALDGVDDDVFKQALKSRDSRIKNIYYNHAKSKEFLDYLNTI